MKKFELVFWDGSTHTVEASSIQDAFVVGKMLAAERGTYLYKIVEK